VVVVGIRVTMGMIIGAIVVVVVSSGVMNTRMVVVVEGVEVTVDVVEVTGTVVDVVLSAVEVVDCCVPASVVLLTPPMSTTSTFLSEPQNMHPHKSATASNVTASLMHTH